MHSTLYTSSATYPTTWDATHHKNNNNGIRSILNQCRKINNHIILLQITHQQHLPTQPAFLDPTSVTATDDVQYTFHRSENVEDKTTERIIVIRRIVDELRHNLKDAYDPHVRASISAMSENVQCGIRYLQIMRMEFLRRLRVQVQGPRTDNTRRLVSQKSDAIRRVRMQLVELSELSCEVADLVPLELVEEKALFSLSVLRKYRTYIIVFSIFIIVIAWRRISI